MQASSTKTQTGSLCYPPSRIQIRPWKYGLEPHVQTVQFKVPLAGGPPRPMRRRSSAAAPHRRSSAPLRP
eukprot:scaffold1069_cov390-Prasinococcus_capsulatus_cf.AAC.1